ncbi:hypothetical protein [Mesorhizobium sp.]|uniref:hypothetical protein n=1 Tax=Mesorhizobium sp. TaxID=1871066 RepID=UPI000FE5113A|nr:hypothetical protein [Mesorhizobium sp.]RWK46951.1 MAG: hypothetical protein EOR48_32850 [Mesorhizobium sp.]TIP38818.1 MAG: hypothetical protein E5X62_32735 [Mesorhizobium sp.]
MEMAFALAMVTPRLTFAAADRLYSGVGSMKGFAATKIARLETADGHWVHHVRWRRWPIRPQALRSQ